MELKNWNEEDLEQLDAKFDALTEHLGVEFVFETVSDGTDIADRSRVYVRSKVKVKEDAVNIPPVILTSDPEQIGVDEEPSYYKKKKTKY